MQQYLTNLFQFSNQSIVITGGAGILGAEMARGLAACGANIAIMDFNLDAAEKVAGEIADKYGVAAIAIKADVLNRNSVGEAVTRVFEKFRKIDGLINGAGGNKPDATTSPDKSFFDLPSEAMRWVFDLNLIGSIIPSQVIGQHMAQRNQGVILNVSSMNAFRPLTRIPAYSAAKAGVSNFTQWLAVHLAQEYSANIRVNAIAPGFFLTDQNRYLLTDPKSGELTPRGNRIIEHTPMGRFGNPVDLIGTVLWLMSPASAFVTGVVVPVDGGFSAFSGV